MDNSPTNARKEWGLMINLYEDPMLLSPVLLIFGYAEWERQYQRATNKTEGYVKLSTPSDEIPDFKYPNITTA